MDFSPCVWVVLVLEIDGSWERESGTFTDWFSLESDGGVPWHGWSRLLLLGVFSGLTRLWTDSVVLFEGHPLQRSSSSCLVWLTHSNP